MDSSEQVLKEFIRKPENKKCFICGCNVLPAFLRLINSLLNTLLWIFKLLFVLHAVVFSMYFWCLLIWSSLEFGNHVKNVSLASFTSDEVKKLLSGGNKVIHQLLLFIIENGIKVFTEL